MKIKTWNGRFAASPIVRTAVVASMYGAALFAAGNASAMPNFARRYNADCGLCHTQVPKLNRFGYEFRLAGYRAPGEIGKDEKPFNLGDFFTARIQEQYNYQKHETPTGAGKTTNSQLEFVEATLYPLTGAWGKNFASLVELSMAPGDIFEVENAYVRGAWGDQDGWFQAKIGVMHPWEGFGASDRPLGNIRPLFQKMSAGAQKGDGGVASAASGSPFYLWNLDESAAEVGYHYPKTGTSVAARVSNGLIWNPDAPNFVDPAQGGELSKGRTDPAHNSKNYQFFLNQFITDSSAVSLVYYHGSMPYVKPDELAAGVSNPVNTFDRLALYGNYFVLPKLNLLAGYSRGKDDVDKASVASAAAASGLTLFNPNNLGKNKGYFLEANYHAAPKFAFGGRYDMFDPSDAVSHNTTKAATLFANWSVYQGLQLIGDIQRKKTELTAGGENTDTQFLLRGIIIF